jgi:hypothetical protein
MHSRAILRSIRPAVLALLVSPVLAQAQVAPTLTLQAPRNYLQGDQLIVRAIVTFPGACPPASTPSAGMVTVHGIITPNNIYPLSAWGVQRTCSSGSYSEAIDFNAGNILAPLDFTISAEYSGGGGFAPATAGPTAVSVVPYLSGLVANGTARMTVASSDATDGFYCATHTATFDASAPADVPALKDALGQVSYSFDSCTFECGFLCWPGAPKFPLQVVTLQMPQALPPDASVWVHAAGSGMTTPVWRHVPATIDGATVTFALTGNDKDQALSGTLVIVPTSAGARGELQDLWWGGIAQNGWGLDIAQQGDRIFAGLFAYRSDGSPVWVVMPGGTWDSTHTVFSGTLYGATGSSFLNYDASRLDVEPTGTAKLSFSGTGAATFDYTIGTESGRKSLVRQPVGSTAQPVQGPHAGLWWGGSTKNGWGITVAHQDDTLFAVWYTYDANGNAEWFVMPGGSWLGAEDNPSYAGTLYRTTGSPFLGGAYDPSKLVVTPVGRIGFTFYGSDIAYMSYTVDGQSGRETLYRQPF